MFWTHQQFVVSHRPPVVPRSSCVSRPGKRRQRGAIAVMSPFIFLVILGFCGFAIDLSLIYNRKVELQGAADAIALAAARQLDGTPAGISNALEKAAEAADAARYKYNGRIFTWSDSALEFGTGPDGGSGGWKDSGSVGSAQDVFFVKVDMRALDSSLGEVDTIIMKTLTGVATRSINSRAIAGRSTIKITPLAICALSESPAEERSSGELVEYGFRRGVGYNLMDLNPKGTTAENFLINPFAQPGSPGTALSASLDLIRPFVCTGTLAMPTVRGGSLTAERPFPIGSVYEQLNSRFGSVPLCAIGSAPPDANVKAYTYSGGASWMNLVAPATVIGQTAQRREEPATPPTSDGKLWTVADPDPKPGTNTAGMYGPLWSYERAVPYTSYTGGPEPEGGYASYDAVNTVMPLLYTTGVRTSSFSYPIKNVNNPRGTPYWTTAGPHFEAPSGPGKGVHERRVLNIPLLQCPVPSGSPASVNVLAIAKFFMTVPATSTALSAEFAGLAQEGSLGGKVELYP